MPEKPGRSKRSASPPSKVVPIHEGAEPLRASLDDTDLAIVRALQANARATYTEIGKAVGLSAASVAAASMESLGRTLTSESTPRPSSSGSTSAE